MGALQMGMGFVGAALCSLFGDAVHAFATVPPAMGVLAVGAAWMLRGPGGDAGGLAAAQGRLERVVRAGLESEASASGAPKP